MSMPDEALAIQRLMAAQQVQQAQRAPGTQPSAKELLDAYRAFNGGALPPGMSPEQAQMIDSGVPVPTEVLAANPALAGIIQQMQAANSQFNVEAQAARAQVGNNYQQLTGDVENQGQAYMADIMKRMGVDPAAAQYDPTLTGYGETIANMGETADQNQATDQAWFDKFIAQTNAMNQSAISNLLATPLVPAEGGGGGGGGGGGRGGRGGGGFRRRGYGGGGGSGGGSWTTPKTTDTMTQTAAVDAVEYNPGFDDYVLEMFSDPGQQEYAQQLLDRYGGAPRDTGSGIVKNELPQVQAAIDMAVAQAAQRRLYRDKLPASVALDIDRANSGNQDYQMKYAQYADDDRTSANQLAMMEPEDRKDFEATLASGVYEALARAQESKRSWNNPVMPQILAEKARNNSQYIRQERDKQLWERAQAEATTDNPFTYEGWKGYVPQVDVEAVAENGWAKNILERVLGASREFNPNYDMQVTKKTMKDSSNTKTTQSSKAPENQLFDNDIPSADGQAFSAYTPFGTGIGLGSNLTAAGQRALENRLQKLRARAAVEEPAQPTGGGWGGKAMRKAVPVASTQRRAGRPGGEAFSGTTATSNNPIRSTVKPTRATRGAATTTSGWNAFGNLTKDRTPFDRDSTDRKPKSKAVPSKAAKKKAKTAVSRLSRTIRF